MPLSFLAGIYGMNFDSTGSRWNMPELAPRYGYPTLVRVTLLIATILIALFWREGWFDLRCARAVNPAQQISSK